MIDLDRDFLNTLANIKPVIINEKIWNELNHYYPDRYVGLDYATKKMNEESLTQASKDYLKIVKSHMIVNGIPILIETLTAAYLWGVDNLLDKGIHNAPPEIKHIIGKMWHELEPQNEQLKNFL